MIDDTSSKGVANRHRIKTCPSDLGDGLEEMAPQSDAICEYS